MVSPPTGWAVLDVVLRRPGAALGLAHRGGARHPEIEGLENTRAAFAHAVALGYDHLETDVHTTRDGVLLAFHDDVLDRVTDGTGRVADLSAAQVGEARVGGRGPVPTLLELLQAFPGACFNVDLKSDGAVAVLARLVERHGLHDRLVVGSFGPRRIRRFRRLTGGRVATAADVVEVALFLLCPSWLAARLAPRAAALQVPERRGPLRVVSPRLVRRAHAAGRHVHVWTVDDPADMHRLLDLGVDGLFTDRTDVLAAVLRERGQWLGRTGGWGRIAP